MEIRISGFYLEKSWRITPHVIFLILLGIVSIGAFSVFTWPEKESPPPLEIPASKKEEASADLLERLTPAEPKPTSQEEKEESDRLLEQLTPAKPKTMTGEEQKELEELFKQLTP